MFHRLNPYLCGISRVCWHYSGWLSLSSANLH